MQVDYLSFLTRLLVLQDSEIILHLIVNLTLAMTTKLHISPHQQSKVVITFKPQIKQVI